MVVGPRGRNGGLCRGRSPAHDITSPGVHLSFYPPGLLLPLPICGRGCQALLCAAPLRRNYLFYPSLNLSRPALGKTHAASNLTISVTTSPFPERAPKKRKGAFLRLTHPPFVTLIALGRGHTNTPIAQAGLAQDWSGIQFNPQSRRARGWTRPGLGSYHHEKRGPHRHGSSFRGCSVTLLAYRTPLLLDLYGQSLFGLALAACGGPASAISIDGSPGFI